MRTYGEVFRTPEFTPLFLTSSVQVAAQTVGGLALGTLIFTTTGSPLLASLAMFGPPWRRCSARPRSSRRPTACPRAPR